MLPSTGRSLSIAVCVATLLLLAGIGAAGPQGETPDGTVDFVQPQHTADVDLPERVGLSPPVTSGSAQVGPDAGAAIDRSGSRIDGAYQQYLLEERLDSADGGDERQTILNQSADDIETGVERLRERERSARQSYRDGEIDAGSYLATLRSIDDQASQLEERAFEITPPPTEDAEGLTDTYDVPGVASRIATLRGDVIALQGPVRSSLGDRMDGSTAPSRVYVSASENGTVLSLLADGTYQREAIRPGLVQSRSETGISLSDANELATNDLYPEAAEHYTFTRSNSISSGRIYLVTAIGQYDGSDGSLRSYIDAVSETTFWEYQQIDVGERAPLGPAVTNASGSTNVSVRATYPTGLAQVTVTNGTTPISNASVAVGGTVVAETDADGRAWVVLPSNASVVTTTAAGETIEVPIEWGPDGVMPGGNRTSA